ncbi:acyl-CoA desaturase [Cyanobacterium sp. Dongsha4]|uniref:acyl-CoA desaturase n=1 Tax=Cyanobacterium sp. DS4 TaxID=2878255 RepID=UPI002E80B2EC|nr:acyl-CoA desaturase [Cyanobacterium sp. Dongsha4]WVL00561.1 acyl-CoA desaturase [Cyanobacterium sp. Dongsha4]
MQKVIPAHRVTSPQYSHFIFWTVIPCLATITAFCLTIIYPISGLELGVWLGMWILTGGLGISVGFHRHFTHRAFDAKPWLQVLMAVAGSMAGQSSLIYWVCIHRRHHELSDKSGDPHSPTSNVANRWSQLRSFWHGHFNWVVCHDVPIPSVYAKDLLRNPTLKVINRTYPLWMLLGLLLPGLFVGLIEGSYLGFINGVLWGGFVRIFIGNQIIWSINSVCHTFGNQDYNTGDNSRNNFWLAIPAFGEGWHNNHHAFQYSAKFGIKPWQLDSGYAAIWLMEKLGWVYNVKQPT